MLRPDRAAMAHREMPSPPVGIAFVGVPAEIADA